MVCNKLFVIHQLNNHEWIGFFSVVRTFGQVTNLTVFSKEFHRIKNFIRWKNEHGTRYMWYETNIVRNLKHSGNYKDSLLLEYSVCLTSYHAIELAVSVKKISAKTKVCLVKPYLLCFISFRFVPFKALIMAVLTLRYTHTVTQYYNISCILKKKLECPSLAI